MYNGLGGGTVADRVAEALFGKTRRNVLSLLFGRPDEQFYMRQIARMTGVSTASVQHELARLTEAELVIRSPDGKQVYYRANTVSPVFSEIRNLMEKTVGAVAVLRTTLSELSGEGRIDLAFLYGSFASGTQVSASDVDVMVIGDTTLSELIPVLRQAQDRLGREINPSVYPRAEFQERLRAGEHFVSRVLERPKIMLIGTEDELEKLAG
jgi:predicted nucleotidyltransferase